MARFTRAICFTSLSRPNWNAFMVGMMQKILMEFFAGRENAVFHFFDRFVWRYSGLWNNGELICVRKNILKVYYYPKNYA